MDVPSSHLIQYAGTSAIFPYLGVWMAASWKAEDVNRFGIERDWGNPSEALAALPGCNTIQRQNQYVS